MQYVFNRYAPDSAFYPSEPMQRAKVDSLLNYGLYKISFYESLIMSHSQILLF